MHPELFTLPVLGIGVKTYGFCLMVGFLSAVWLAMRRAARVKADPDRVIDLSFLALVFGVGGARLFYVIHYWKTDFAPLKNVWFAVIDIRQGGLEFLGGFLGATAAVMIYLAIKRQSIRLYLDILAPGLLWGLAIGRIGCFFNGCCFGGVCVAEGTDQAKYPWAVEFPYGSPAHLRQWQDRDVTIPAELISMAGNAGLPLPAATLNLSVEARERPQRDIDDLKTALAEAKEIDADSAEVRALNSEIKSKEAVLVAWRKKNHLDALEMAQRFPSREHPERKTSVSELQDLAAQCHSLPVHPTQLYASVSAFLMSGLLSAVFYVRKRHGIVIALAAVLYPISRFVIEMIRTDNPHDTLGLTISQFVSVLVFAGGVAFIVVIYKWMPERSPRADAARPVEEPEAA